MPRGVQRQVGPSPDPSRHKPAREPPARCTHRAVHTPDRDRLGARRPAWRAFPGGGMTTTPQRADHRSTAAAMASKIATPRNEGRASPARPSSSTGPGTELRPLPRPGSSLPSGLRVVSSFVPAVVPKSSNVQTNAPGRPLRLRAPVAAPAAAGAMMRYRGRGVPTPPTAAALPRLPTTCCASARGRRHSAGAPARFEPARRLLDGRRHPQHVRTRRA